MGKDEDLLPAQPELVYRNPAWDRYHLTDECESFLREAGTPEELKLREERLLFEFAEILRTVPPDALSEEQRFFINETMNIMREHLTKLREQAEWARAMLSREGFRFDRGRNRVERIEGLSTLRRRRFSQEVIAIYESEESSENTRTVRVRIAEELRGAYPPEMLSPRAYFPIWQCIEEHRKRAG
ncbi:MAG: hypothetical protein ACRD21_01200 [Vicinamibacteria bacterium]